MILYKKVLFLHPNGRYSHQIATLLNYTRTCHPQIQADESVRYNEWGVSMSEGEIKEKLDQYDKIVYKDLSAMPILDRLKKTNIAFIYHSLFYEKLQNSLPETKFTPEDLRALLNFKTSNQDQIQKLARNIINTIPIKYIPFIYCKFPKLLVGTYVWDYIYVISHERLESSGFHRKQRTYNLFCQYITDLIPNSKEVFKEFDEYFRASNNSFSI
jgi:hypothetical protein